MTIQQIKTEMKQYRDFYGGELLDSEQIDKATSKEELEKIVEDHRNHMEDMLSDAMSHLDRFKRKIGI